MSTHPTPRPPPQPRRRPSAPPTSEVKIQFIIINGPEETLTDRASTTRNSNPTPVPDANDHRWNVITELWPGSRADIFSFFPLTPQELEEPTFHLTPEMLVSRADEIAASLHERTWGYASSDEIEPLPIIFLAHSIGSLVVKEILLRAVENPDHLWIFSWTLAVHFFDSETYHTQKDVEQHIIKLLANQTPGLSFSRLPTYFNGLPDALARLDLEFLALSQGLDVQYHQTELKTGSSSANKKTIFDFHTNQPQYLDVLFEIMSLTLGIWYQERGRIPHYHLVGRKCHLPCSACGRRPQSSKLQYGYRKLLAFLPGLDSAEPVLGWIKPDFPWNEKMKSRLEQDSPELKAWRDSPGSSLLQIIGPPGSGAGHICASVATMLLQQERAVQSGSHGILILSFDFHLFDARQNTERRLVSSLFRQMLLTRPDVYRNMTKVMDLITETAELPVSLMWNLLHCALAAVKAETVFLIVHAVHQCVDPGVGEKLAMLTTKKLISKSIKVLMTNDVHLPLELPEHVESHQLSLTTDTWTAIVRSVAEQRVSRITRENPAWYQRKEEIMDVLFAQKHTHFDIMLHIDSLEYTSQSWSTAKTLQDWLSSPDRQQNRPWTKLKDEVKRLRWTKYTLSWIANAVRPLTASELAVVSVFHEEFPVEHELDRSALISLAENISSNPVADLGHVLKMFVRLKDDEFTLPHYTFRGALDNLPESQVPHPHVTMARQCLQFIKLWAQSDSLTDRQDWKDSLKSRVYPFLAYAVRFWHKHYQLAAASKDTDGDLKCTLDQEVLQFIRSDPESASIKTWTNHYRMQKDIISDPLLLAIRFRFDRIVLLILDGVNSELDDQRAQRALELAVRWLDDAPEVIQRLAHIHNSSYNHDHGPVFCAAAASDRALCLQSSQNQYLPRHMCRDLTWQQQPGEEDSWWATFIDVISHGHHPLVWAASHGSSRGVDLLLSSGCIDVLVRNGDGNTSVHHAAKYGATDMLKSLGEHARPEFTEAVGKGNIAGYLPIHLACEAGSPEAFELLFNEAATREQDLTCLFNHAIRSGIGEIVERLIQAGACAITGGDANATSPLQVASELGHYNVIVQLCSQASKTLAKEQNVSILRECWKESLKNSLKAATVNWRGEIVQHLSEKVDTPDLHEIFLFAIETGNLDAVRILVSKLNESDEGGVKDRKRWWQVGYLGPLLRHGHVHLVRYLLSQHRDAAALSQSDNPTIFNKKLWQSATLAVKSGRSLCLREILRMLPQGTRPTLKILEIAAAEENLSSLREIVAWTPHNNVQSLSSDFQQAMLAAALKRKTGKRAKWRRVGLLLGCAISPNIVTVHGNPPLHMAIGDKAYGAVELMLERGVNPNIRDLTGETALHVAVAAGDADAIQFLLDHGADPSIFDNEGLAPLHAAIVKLPPSIDVIRVLLGMEKVESVKGRTMEGTVETVAGKRTADVHLRREGIPRRPTPLIMAVEAKKIDMVRTLLEAGADPNISDLFNNSPIIRAIDHFSGDVEILQHLLDFGANPNSSGNERVSPLQRAIEMSFDTEEYIDVVKCLLAAGVDPNTEFGCYSSPLNATIWAGSCELLELMVRAGARVDKTPQPFGSPFHLLWLSTVSFEGGRSSDDVLKMSEVLLQCGADLNARDPRSGSAPLLVEISDGRSTFIEELGDEHELDMSVVNDMGQTALHFAATYNKDSGMINKMLERGATPLARDHLGHSALYYSVLNANRTSRTKANWVSCFDKLLDAIPPDYHSQYLSEVITAAVKTGIDLGQDENGGSPFEIVVERHGFDLDPNVTDANGWTALDIANKLGMTRVADRLRAMAGMAGAKKKRPTRLSSVDRNMFVVVSEDGMEASLHAFGPTEPDYKLWGAVRADSCIPPDVSRFDFTIEVLECGSQCLVAVGIIGSEQLSLNNYVGWKSQTWGYHSDDGTIMSGRESLADPNTSAEFGVGDKVGVSVDMVERTIRFEKNGEPVGITVTDVVGQLYPAVSFQAWTGGGAKVRVDFDPTGTDKASEAA